MLFYCSPMRHSMFYPLSKYGVENMLASEKYSVITSITLTYLFTYALR